MMNEKVNYKEKDFLLQRTATEQDVDIKVDTFLDGDAYIAEWEDNQNDLGFDDCRISPAWVDGKRAFMIERSWNAAPGYCASGIEEELITFEKGVEILLKLGAYDCMFGEKNDC